MQFLSCREALNVLDLVSMFESFIKLSSGSIFGIFCTELYSCGYILLRRYIFQQFLPYLELCQVAKLLNQQCYTVHSLLYNEHNMLHFLVVEQAYTVCVC